MACVRGCSGTPICSALDLCCIQFGQDCGKECDGTPDGFSTIQIDINGDLVICSNIGGSCVCQTLTEWDCTQLNTCSIYDLNDVTGIPPSLNDLLVYNGSSWVAADISGVFHCNLLNSCSINHLADVDGTGAIDNDLLIWDNTAGEWLPGALSTLFDCSLLASCDLVDLGDVTGPFVNGDVLQYNGTIWTGVSTILPSQTDTFADNGDGSVTHTSSDGTAVTVDICADLLPQCVVENLGNVAAGAGNDNILVSQAGTWVPTDICNAIEAADCTLLHQEVTQVIDVSLALPVPGTQTLIEPVTSLSFTNTSGSPMLVTVLVDGNQIPATNGDATPSQLRTTVEYSLNGGSTWIGATRQDNTIWLDVTGNPGSQQTLQTPPIHYTGIIAAGVTFTFDYRRFYYTDTTFNTGVVDADGVDIQITGVAIPSP